MKQKKILLMFMLLSVSFAAKAEWTGEFNCFNPINKDDDSISVYVHQNGPPFSFDFMSVRQGKDYYIEGRPVYEQLKSIKIATLVGAKTTATLTLSSSKKEKSTLQFGLKKYECESVE